jgi:hypothetical protein
MRAKLEERGRHLTAPRVADAGEQDLGPVPHAAPNTARSASIASGTSR